MCGPEGILIHMLRTIVLGDVNNEWYLIMVGKSEQLGG